MSCWRACKVKIKEVHGFRGAIRREVEVHITKIICLFTINKQKGELCNKKS